ncbi:MAG: hypothetical protein JSR21_18045 [Proteobacteria bacterium]|nr:hypothetical protein [Pseudomonadota bacterium]
MTAAAPAAAPRRRPLWPWAAAAAALLCAVGVSLAVIKPWRPPGAALPLLSIEAILADQPTEMRAFRLDQNPKIVVLDFPDLHAQARMFDRIGVFVEKTGSPHDRPLSDSALESAIRRLGDTYDTLYYGHDYRAADLLRFFAAADRNGVTLNDAEQRLRALLKDLGWKDARAEGAIITLPRAGSASDIDARVREIILRHELSHGEYFTSESYADFVHNFWRDALTDAEREKIRAFLGKDGYDTGVEDLMMNEAQAYMMFTPKSEFFDPALLGIPKERLDVLRLAFYLGMPRNWLRDQVTDPPRPPKP